MKATFLTIAAILIFYSFPSAQTTVPAGSVSGTWTLAGSPYLVQGAIMIPNEATLTIEPGVTVNFQGSYKLFVQGRLLAIGTAADTITFTTDNTSVGWLGVHFENTPVTNDSSKFFYCKLQYGISPDHGGAFYIGFPKVIISNCRISNCTTYNTIGGGAIYCAGNSPIITNSTISNNTSTSNGGGICCENSNPTITNNTISNNSASSCGGGIYCFGIYNSSNAIILNNIISNNTAFNGGGIFCTNNSPTISNNIISNNTASYGGGIICTNDGTPTITNNTISNNLASVRGGGICCEYTYANPTFSNNTISNNSAASGGALSCTLYSNITLYNTIMWGNTATTSGHQVYLDDENSDPNFYYCDIQGGMAQFGLNSSIFYTGVFQNNIDADPLFVLPSLGSGTEFNGVTADWSLQETSPCINAGTPDITGLNLPATDIAGKPRIIGGRIDIGANEFGTPGSINDLLATFSMVVYPNPATNSITIEIQQKSQIEIINIKGQVIKTINSINPKTTIDIENIPSGVYVVKAKTDKGIAIRKFVKE
jgi:parallel beta-helix repeat protein